VYCAFYSELFDANTCNAFLESLERELDMCIDGESSPETVYFGGGTPSILDNERLERLLQTIHDRMDLSKVVEWTLEANPGTLTDRKLSAVKAAGVNRISLGAQSFDDEVLRQMGRRHSATDISDSVETVRSAGFEKIGIDLITCLPGVDTDGWKRDLLAAARLEPDHLSVYALSVEEKSVLHAMVKDGHVSMPSEQVQIHALAIAEDILGGAGYNRYEISNYSRPGSECLHNLSCWRGGDYVGFGPAASSRVGRKRWSNSASLDGYVSRLFQGLSPNCDAEILSKEMDATERLMFAFRLKEGVFLNDFVTEDLPMDHWHQALLEQERLGLVEQRDERWFLTNTGCLLADAVAEALIPSSPAQPA
jgi:oxygen-independent coproporphyrinogen-3 oxidase